jgi:adenosylhomocysteine nucleosidase
LQSTSRAAGHGTECGAQNQAVTGRVVVVSALTAELAMLRQALSQEETIEIAPGIGCWQGAIDGHSVTLAEAGIGKVAMAMVATAIIGTLHPQLIIVTGVAGGLDPDLGVGDVVLADRLVQHDFGVAQPGGLAIYQAGHLPFFNPTNHLGFETDAALLALAMSRLTSIELGEVAGRRPRIAVGTVLTGDQFINAPDVRHRLRNELNGIAVEMEGGALAQVGEALQVPFLVIRALSDLAGEAAPSPALFAEFVDAASANSARVVRALLPAFA